MKRMKMKIRQNIEMEAVVHKRTIPSDLSEYMYEKNVDMLPKEYRYFSKSADKYFSIFDLELHHFIRIFINKNAIDEDDVVDKIKRILAVA